MIVLLAAGVLAVAVLVAVFWGKEILFSTFDRTGFRAAGYREWPIELLTLVLITATVVTAMPAVGAILAIALIAAPAAAARLLVRTAGRIAAAGAGHRRRFRGHRGAPVPSARRGGRARPSRSPPPPASWSPSASVRSAHVRRGFTARLAAGLRLDS